MCALGDSWAEIPIRRDVASPAAFKKEVMSIDRWGYVRVVGGLQGLTVRHTRNGGDNVKRRQDSQDFP